MFYIMNISNLSEKEKIKGAILIYSCHKHKNTRLSEFKLPNNEYSGWKVFYFLGNPSIKSEYIVIKNTILLKCEDSYIHVAKKVVLGIKYIYDKYDVEEGILRCGDDLQFDENRLRDFLKNTTKHDYMGVVANPSTTISAKYDNFMPNYYNNHPNELTPIINGIPYSLSEMQQFNIVPDCQVAGGVVVYLSNKSCDILINHFSKIKYDIFKVDIKYGYPYIIEDIAVGFVLQKNGVKLTPYYLYENNADRFNKNVNAVAVHTNKYK